MSCRFTNGISDLAIDPVNPKRIYAVAQDQHRVRVIDRARQTVDTVAGSGSSGCTDGIYLVARFSNPREVVVTRPGILEYTDLYVSDYSCRKIRRVRSGPA